MSCSATDPVGRSVSVYSWDMSYVAALIRVRLSASERRLLCCRAGVNGDLISWFAAPGVSSACQEHIAELLQVTGAYSISGNRAASQPAPGSRGG